MLIHVIAVNSYYDKQMKRRVTVGDEFRVDEERYKSLSSKKNAIGMVLVEEKNKGKQFCETTQQVPIAE